MHRLKVYSLNVKIIFMNNKFLKITRTCLISIITFVILLLIGVRIGFRTPVHNFYKNSKKAFVIPGLSEGYIAQGISYDEATDNFFLTGYMNDKSASPIYVVSKSTNKIVTSVRMANPDGSDFTGHAGGLTVAENKVYVAGSADECLYVFNKSDILNAENKSYVKYIDVVNLKNATDGIGVAFTTIHDGLIYVGEFYREGPYPTRETHTIPTKNGCNKALAVGFNIEGNTATPEVVYSLPDNIQGMCFTEDSILLSESWGASFSSIHKYNYDNLKESGTYNFLGRELPLYILEETNKTKKYKIAPMAEEIEYVNGQVYISNESASKKYKFGKFTGGKWCYASKF